MQNDLFCGGARFALALEELYLSFGYKPYKLPGFEEYSLYAENKPFLQTRDITVFEAGGKLCALRPDVTLSVIKNARPDDGVLKLFYNEKVYRKERGRLKELGQTGVEIIGKVDPSTEREAVELMLRTLKIASESVRQTSACGDSAQADYLLEVSHVGITQKCLNACGFVGKDREFAAECIRAKNRHDFIAFARGAGVDGQIISAVVSLMSLPSEPEKAFEKLSDECAVLGVESEIKELKSLVEGKENIAVNLSAAGDPEYYSGAVFKGYIRGLPNAVLSGGRYDNLLGKLAKQSEAIGFALYLGELERFAAQPKFEPDIVVTYTPQTADEAERLAEKLRREGKRTLVAATAPRGVTAKIIKAGEEQC